MGRKSAVNNVTLPLLILGGLVSNPYRPAGHTDT